MSDMNIKKVKSKSKLKEPRLSIFSADIPSRIIDMFNNERCADSKSDGFISRFVVVCPEPKFIELCKHNAFKYFSKIKIN